MGLGDGADDSEGEPREIAPLLSAQAGGRIWASSMGISFCVPKDVTSVLVTVDWGHYAKVESEHFLRKDGSGGRTAWKRHPVSQPTAGSAGRTVLTRRPRTRISLMCSSPRGSSDQAGQRWWIWRWSTGRSCRTAARTRRGCFSQSLTVTATDGEAAVFYPLSDPAEDPSVLARQGLRGPSSRAAVPRQPGACVRAQRGSRRAGPPGRATGMEARPRPGCRRMTCRRPSHPRSRTPRCSLGLNWAWTSWPASRPADLTRALLPLADGYATWLQQRSAEVSRPPGASARHGGRGDPPSQADRGTDQGGDRPAWHAGERAAGGVPVCQQGDGAAAAPQRDRAGAGEGPGPCRCGKPSS